MSQVTYCPDCHRMEGISCTCGMPYKEKLRSIHVHGSVTPTQTKRKYWDQGALESQFGDHARDYSLDMTDGQGLNDAPREPAQTFI